MHDGHVVEYDVGTPFGQNVSEEGDYVPTKYATHGMKGTDLPKMPLGIKWTIGGSAEVTWQVRNNHGGGYQYRLVNYCDVCRYIMSFYRYTI